MVDDKTKEMRDILEDNLTTMWHLYDEIEQYVTDREGKDDVPDFSSYVESVIQEPKDQFLEMIDSSNITQIGKAIGECKRCPLGAQRVNAVPGSGPINAKVMIIGEGPGREEDQSGEPFVGPSGAYLDSWLKAISLQRDLDVFITNVVKCRPPENRNPTPLEIDTCGPFLEKQIALVKPEVILCLGLTASHYVLQKEGTLSSLRNRVHHYNHIPLFVTYHPSAVLRNKSLRGEVWKDLQMLANFLQLPIQQKRSR